MESRLKQVPDSRLSLPESQDLFAMQSTSSEASVDEISGENNGIADEMTLLSWHETPLLPMTPRNLDPLRQKPSKNLEIETALQPWSSEFALSSAPPVSVSAADTSALEIKEEWPVTEPEHPPLTRSSIETTPASSPLPKASPETHQSSAPPKRAPNTGSNPSGSAAKKTARKKNASKAHTGKQNPDRHKLYDITTGKVVPKGLPKRDHYLQFQAYVKRFLNRRKTIKTYVDDQGNPVDGITEQTLYAWQLKQKRAEFRAILATGGNLPLPPSRAQDKKYLHKSEIKPRYSSPEFGLYDIHTGNKAPQGKTKSEQYISLDAYVSRFVSQDKHVLNTYVDNDGNEVPGITKDTHQPGIHRTLFASQRQKIRNEFLALSRAGKNLPPILRKKWARSKTTPNPTLPQKEAAHTSSSASYISGSALASAPAPSRTDSAQKRKLHVNHFFESSASGITEPAHRRAKEARLRIPDSRSPEIESDRVSATASSASSPAFLPGTSQKPATPLKAPLSLNCHRLFTSKTDARVTDHTPDRVDLNNLYKLI